MVPYKTTSRGYLERALERLTSGSEKDLFYTAFELRCGIEARIQEYLERSAEVAKKVKQGWSIAKLSKAGQKAYLSGPRIQRLAQLKGGALSVVFYFTPVGVELVQNGGKLGNYLHALKDGPGNDAWWEELRTLLLGTATGLTLANRGTLLGPALFNRRTGEVSICTEHLGPESSEEFRARVGKVGEDVVIKVSYVDALPDPIEEQAQIWSPPINLAFVSTRR